MPDIRTATRPAKKPRIPPAVARGDHNGSNTRSAILEAAVHHFAAFGYEGAHIRKMLADIGQNLSLAHYYFGSKEALYEAAVRHYCGGVLAVRREGLIAWQQQTSGRPEDRLCDLFQAYVEPHMHVAMGPGGHDYARLMQRAHSDPSPHGGELLKDVMSVRSDYMTALHQLVPATESGLLTRSMDSLVSIMLAESIEQSSQNGRRKVETATATARFVARFSAGGLLHVIGDGASPPRAAQAARRPLKPAGSRSA
jgi:AcrR family transcriptional regulator